jgi:hypothetical protein
MGKLMSATSPKTPPGFLQSLVGPLLPPERREQVLGDMEERFRAAPPSRALPRYLFEVVTVVPAILFTQLRSWSVGPGVPRPLQSGSGLATVRAQVQEFQYENYSRLLIYFSLIALLSFFITGMLMFKAERWSQRLIGGTVIAMFLFTAHQHSRRGSARAIPEEDSLSALIAFHRRELARRRDFLRTLWYWKMAPLALPVLIALLVKQNGKTASTALWSISCLVFASLAARCQARGIQKRIDELDTLVL